MSFERNSEELQLSRQWISWTDVAPVHALSPTLRLGVSTTTSQLLDGNECQRPQSAGAQCIPVSDPRTSCAPTGSLYWIRSVIANVTAAKQVFYGTRLDVENRSYCCCNGAIVDVGKPARIALQ